MEIQALDNDELLWQEKVKRILMYLVRFEGQLSSLLYYEGPMSHFEKAKNYGAIKGLMNPEYCSIKQITVLELEDRKVQFKVALIKTGPGQEIKEVMLDEAKEIAPHLCAFYANVKKWPRYYKDWEWAADEKWCPIVE